jgi:hypothetical protein
MFPSISVLNDLQIEHAAINYLEVYLRLFLLHTIRSLQFQNNIRENYSRSTQLLSSAIAQYKKYGCKNMQQGCFVRLAEDYIFIRDYSKAHQVQQFANYTK